MNNQQKPETPAEIHYYEVVRNMSLADIQRIQANEVSANECVQSPKMTAAVDAWRAILVERGQDPGLMHHQV